MNLSNIRDLLSQDLLYKYCGDCASKTFFGSSYFYHDEDLTQLILDDEDAREIWQEADNPSEFFWRMIDEYTFSKLWCMMAGSDFWTLNRVIPRISTYKRSCWMEYDEVRYEMPRRNSNKYKNLTPEERARGGLPTGEVGYIHLDMDKGKTLSLEVGSIDDWYSEMSNIYIDESGRVGKVLEAGQCCAISKVLHRFKDGFMLRTWKGWSYGREKPKPDRGKHFDKGKWEVRRYKNDYCIYRVDV